MMNKIILIKKFKTKYQVTFDNDQIIDFEPMIYTKHHLKLFQIFEKNEYDKLIEDNLYERYKRLGLQRLKRMQTKKELYDYLIDKEASIKIAKQLVYEFNEKRYLDDDAYTKIYVQLHQDQKGPKYLEQQLIKKGVEKAIVDSYMQQINELDILSNLIPKKIRLLNGKKSKKQILIKIKTDLLRLGFHSNKIDESIALCQNDIEEVDIRIVEKYFLKLRAKIKSQELSYEDKQKIFVKLYQKGFPQSLITKVIEQNI